MSTRNRPLRLNLNDLERSLDTYIEAFQPRTRGTLGLHRTTGQRFIAFLRRGKVEDDGTHALKERRLVQWMRHEAGDVRPECVAKRFQALNRFLAAIVRAGVVPWNPMQRFKGRFGKQSWEAIARTLKAPNPHQALHVIQVPPPPAGPLAPYASKYVELNRALGKKYDEPDKIMRRLDTFLLARSVRSVREVTTSDVSAWLASMACTAQVRAANYHRASRFFEHLVSAGVLGRNPCATIEPVRFRTSFRPYIFSTEEVAAILVQANALSATHKFRHRAQTFHTMIALLYALGLRAREVRRLRLGDIDLDQNILFIYQTKFHKSRTIPFGPRIARCLRRYLKTRRCLFPPHSSDSPVFVAFRPTPISGTTMPATFRALLESAGINPSGRRRPRVHDLRHTFAVHRLLSWYRQGVDVQSKLPLLSTFMGHVELSSTEVYLTITSELLNEAHLRFHKHFGGIFDVEA